jgi:hypothetical protein
MERRDKFQSGLRQQAAGQPENVGAGGFRRLRMRSKTGNSVSKLRRYGRLDRPGFIANWISKWHDASVHCLRLASRSSSHVSVLQTALDSLNSQPYVLITSCREECQEIFDSVR